ncbi:hypothetical protein [Paenibacillus macquariensis]|uniref:AbiV family abortive infection protein n=1 Tax=Paenibacillus macquariensis TaxID=948756 RepID=A0ABY1KDN7_9BACL|nr:hypothetical protein [Paenibacillus macquariensis]OAB26242.1 hypothetical protein PMSM_27125 [Paenibacillus macquariensis subsp. macquariensis]SIR66532.1 hypothetical protein SAMN05421578_12939 [Paenibacillus macquariensis]
MKSSLEQLKNRGYLDHSTLHAYINRNIEQLITSNSPVERTAGYLLAREKGAKVSISLLIECLKTESALYSKIALCDTLSLLKEAVPFLIDNMGQIGNNQHFKIPNKVFEKKSYPLPRDICSRTLIRMQSDVVLPIVFKQLETLQKRIISESIDVIGYLSFYNPNNHYYTEVKNMTSSFLSEDIIRYKYAIMLRSFILEETLYDAREIQRRENTEIIKQELGRSISRIEKNL